MYIVLYLRSGIKLCIDDLILLINKQDGRVIYAKIVPNDKAEHILNAMRVILEDRSEDAPVIKVIYTDNVSRDKPGIQKLFKEKLPHLPVGSCFLVTQLITFFFIKGSRCVSGCVSCLYAYCTSAFH